MLWSLIRAPHSPLSLLSLSIPVGQMDGRMDGRIPHQNITQSAPLHYCHAERAEIHTPLPPFDTRPNGTLLFSTVQRVCVG